MLGSQYLWMFFQKLCNFQGVGTVFFHSYSQSSYSSQQQTRIVRTLWMGRKARGEME